MISKMLKLLLVNGDSALQSLNTLGIVAVPNEKPRFLPPGEQNLEPVYNVLRGSASQTFLNSIKVGFIFNNFWIKNFLPDCEVEISINSRERQKPVDQQNARQPPSLLRRWQEWIGSKNSLCGRESGSLKALHRTRVRNRKGKKSEIPIDIWLR